MPQDQQTAVDSNVQPSFPDLNATSTFEHLDQSESDPNYNVTLTPNMFTGMREALNAAQHMEADALSTPSSSPSLQMARQVAVPTKSTSAALFYIGL